MDWLEKTGLIPPVKREILHLAEKWWDAVGRVMVRRTINEVSFDPKVRATQGHAIFITKPTAERDINDGILEARVWEDLSSEEQARVMFQYFSNIWLPLHPEVKLQRRAQ